MHLLFLLNYCKENLCEISNSVVHPIKYLNSGHNLHGLILVPMFNVLNSCKKNFLGEWKIESSFVNIYCELVCRKPFFQFNKQPFCFLFNFM